MTNKQNNKETEVKNSSDLSWWEYFIPGYREYRVIEHLTDKYIKPAKMAVNDVVKAQVSTPIRKKLGITKNSNTLTERNFTEAYQTTLDSISASQLDKQVPNWKERTANGENVTIFVNGKDYNQNYGGTKGNARLLKDRITTPLGQIETTLGSYLVTATPNEFITTDTYDWDSNVHLDEATPYGLFRNMMGRYGTNDKASENEKTHIRITTKRKKNK